MRGGNAANPCKESAANYTKFEENNLKTRENAENGVKTTKKPSLNQARLKYNYLSQSARRGSLK